MIILIACNLRAPITGVGALVNIIREDIGLSASFAGFLTTIPVLAFAAISPVVVYLAGKVGAGRLLLWGIIILNAGILARSLCGNMGLFIGTLAVGLAIGIGNVLLPAIIKEYFPAKIPQMTSLYTAVMQIVSAFSTAVSVPIAIKHGWDTALIIWSFLAFLALLVSIFNRTLQIRNGVGRTACRIHRSPMTWWVTLYMGVQSMVFYSFIAWLSPIMQDKGYSSSEAGYILSIYVVMGIVGSCMLPVFMKKNKTQSATGVQLGVLYTIGMVGMLFGKSLLVLMPSIALCGFCSGTCISFVMALFGLHTSNGADASRLSGTAQSLGYLIAAAGPVGLGKIYDLTGVWGGPLGFLLAATVILIFLGKIVGREEII